MVTASYYLESGNRCFPINIKWVGVCRVSPATRLRGLFTARHCRPCSWSCFEGQLTARPPCGKSSVIRCDGRGRGMAGHLLHLICRGDVGLDISICICAVLCALINCSLWFVRQIMVYTVLVAGLQCKSVTGLLSYRLKYLDTFWMDCHEIWTGESLTFYLVILQVKFVTHPVRYHKTCLMDWHKIERRHPWFSDDISSYFYSRSYSMCF